jgi:hypothetical protein
VTRCHTVYFKGASSNSSQKGFNGRVRKGAVFSFANVSGHCECPLVDFYC